MNFKKLKTKLFSMKGSPTYIAKGFALGSFIGMMPVPGFQVLISLALAPLFRVNKKAACLAVFNTNILTGTFVFAFNYWLGKVILGIHPNFEFPNSITFHSFSTILSAGREVLLCLFLGGAITGVIAAVSTYYFVLLWIKKRKNRIVSDIQIKNIEPLKASE